MKHRFKKLTTAIVLANIAVLAGSPRAQEYGPPDRSSPGDEMIQSWLAREASRIHAQFAADLASRESWEKNRPRYRQEYLEMLGLWPLPEKTPLAATLTGTIPGDGFSVEKLHYQSRPGLHVTANLYRPSRKQDGERLPGVLYVCGHSGMGRNGNKTAFQSHGMWFARHGYVCLVVDSLQLGEIAAKHHGTYNLERWWWHSRGYTPAGVECWNGVRGIDYLLSRPDVDPSRLAVTGISGGGAATFWVAAADERVQVAVPVSGMADLPSYISNRVINGHCDCMFLHNAHAWPWPRIAALIAPRPQLFANSHLDPIFPMDANDRISAALERIYALYGAGDRFDTLVSLGGHDYRRDLRQGIYRFINTHLTHDAREVTDSEVDLPQGEGRSSRYPIDPEKLRVFPGDNDLPVGELNTTIDEHFVPMAVIDVPPADQFAAWKQRIVSELRRLVFRALPERVEPARPLPGGEAEALETEPGIRVYLRRLGSRPRKPGEKPRLLLVVDSPPTADAELRRQFTDKFHDIVALESRGTGRTQWTRKNPPNFVERAHVLLGRTVDTGRVWDTIAVARHLGASHGDDAEIFVKGAGAAAGIAVFAALFEASITGVDLAELSTSYRQPGQTAQFLNLLRVCSWQDALGLLAPRTVWIDSQQAFDQLEKAQRIFAAAGAVGKLGVGPR